MLQSGVPSGILITWHLFTKILIFFIAIIDKFNHLNSLLEETASEVTAGLSITTFVP